MKKMEQLLLSGLFITCIFIVGIYMILTPEEKVSTVENRELAQKPKFEAENFVSGEYMGNFEKYFTDQFPGRNVWLQSFINYQQFTDQTYLFKYYVSDHNWILPKPKYGSPKPAMEKAAEKVNDFGSYLKDEGTEFYYVSAPHKVNNMQFLLPSYIEPGSGDKNKDYFMSQLDKDKVTSVDLSHHFDSFPTEDRKNFYFKTDHHWTGEGALEGYKMMANVMQENSSHYNGGKVSKSDYEEKCVKPGSRAFIGSYNKQLYNSINAKEPMCTLFPKNFEDLKVTKEGEQVKPEEVYGRAFSTEKNNSANYPRLYTGDLRELTITNPAKKEEGNKILIIKDSYANAMSFLIAQDYYQTTIYDPRHNKDRTVKEYVKQGDFDAVVVLYNSTHLTGKNYNFETTSK